MPDIRPFFVMEVLARAKALEREGRDVVHMEIGEPDFPTPVLVRDAAADFIRRGEVRYTPAAGLPELREAISRYYLVRYRVRVDAKRVFITPGASGAFLLSLGMLIRSGAGVVLEDPGYPCYANIVRLFGGIPHGIPVDGATGFHLGVEVLERCWGDGIIGTVVASPANPTGSVLSREGLGELVDFVVGQKSGFLISDEIYHGLEYGEPAATALEYSDHAFVVNSFSKYFGMTGWRLGWLVVPEHFVEDAEKLAQNLFISAPTHSQYAALAAFHEETLRELERRREIFRDRRDLLCGELQKIGFTIEATPAGAFYVYADCSRFSDDSFAFAMDILDRVGVAITPGLDFGQYRPERYVRFCYTAETERLCEGVRRIARFVGSVSGTRADDGA